MSTPRVSVIITCFNYGRFVDRAIESVLGYGYDNLELIVVDDGSTDNSQEVIARYAHLGVVNHWQENGGVARAANAGLDLATGKYFCFLAADDEWTPDRLERPLEILESKPHVGLVYTDMEIIDEDGNLLRPSYFAWMQTEPPSGDLLPWLFNTNVVPGGTLVCRTELRRLWHPIPEQLRIEDWFIAFQVACEHEIEYVPVKGIRYRQHGSNMNLGRIDRTPLLIDELQNRRIMLGHPVVERLDPVVFYPSLAAIDRNPAEIFDAVTVTDAERLEGSRLADEALELARDRDLVAALRRFARSLAADPANRDVLLAAGATFEAIEKRQAGLADGET